MLDFSRSTFIMAIRKSEADSPILDGKLNEFFFYFVAHSSKNYLPRRTRSSSRCRVIKTPMNTRCVAGKNGAAFFGAECPRPSGYERSFRCKASKHDLCHSCFLHRHEPAKQNCSRQRSNYLSSDKRRGIDGPNARKCIAKASGNGHRRICE